MPVAAVAIYAEDLGDDVTALSGELVIADPSSAALISTCALADILTEAADRLRANCTEHGHSTPTTSTTRKDHP